MRINYNNNNINDNNHHHHHHHHNNETAFCFSIYQSWCSTSIACYSTILLSMMTARIKCHSSHFLFLIFYKNKNNNNNFTAVVLPVFPGDGCNRSLS